MTDVIVEVGPSWIRGPNDAPAEWISAALESADDDLALVDERPVHAQGLWEDVLRAVAGDGVDAIVLVCPTWWPSSRVDRVHSAARAVATTVAVRRRVPTLRGGPAGRLTTIVELASELVVVSHPNAPAAVLARRGNSIADAEAVVAAVGTSAAVLMDVPAGVAEAALLAEAIAEGLRARGIAVAFAAEDVMRQTDNHHQVVDVPCPPVRTTRARRRPAVLVGVMSAVLLSVGFALRGTADSPRDAMPMRLLVEGRVGVMVPADWTAQRITSGPGSARVQVASSRDSDIALHITQSAELTHGGLEETARALEAALDAEPEGVFVEFNPSDRRAGKAAVTYRELRADHHVAWAVLVDGTVRIAIGCQSGPGREHLVREACDRAIGSAGAMS